MTLTIRLANWIGGRASRQSQRRPRQHVTSKRTAAKPGLERLEDRLALAGFGPEDGAYLVESWAGFYNSVQIRPSDQAILAGGQFGNYAFGARSASMAVERYDAQGNADDLFGGVGPAQVAAPTGSHNARGSALALQADGKVVVAGFFTKDYDWDVGVARLTSAGQLDSSYGSGGRTAIDTVTAATEIEYANTVALQSTGKAVVAGYSDANSLVARLSTSGALDKGKNAFGTVQKGSAIGYTRSNYGAPLAAVVTPDDKIVAVASRLVRYTANGALDTTFGASGAYGGTAALPAGMTTGSAISLQPDGKIVIAGTASSGSVVLARYTASGKLDTTFGAGSGYATLNLPSVYRVSDVEIQQDGKIVLSSSVRTPDHSAVGVLVARLNANGTLDSNFGGVGYKTSLPAGAKYGGTSFPSSGMALQADGSIIVAGSIFSLDPTVTIGGSGSGAKARVSAMANGVITGISVTNPGAGYDASTTVTIEGGGGSGATATATVENGQITSITVTSGGTGYFREKPLLMRFYGDNAPAAATASSPATAAATDDALIWLLYGDSTTTAKKRSA